MQFRRVRLMALLGAALVCHASLALAQNEKKKNKKAAQVATVAAAKPVRPRLVVSIVIDQFRHDYLQRFGDQFGEGGFKRFLHQGAVFANANYIHSPTVTACGHATVLSGATPALNGIIANEWYDRELGKNVSSVSDDKAQFKVLGADEKERASAPHKLLGTTLGDEMRLATNGQAKVIGMSYKDRSAILPVGKRPQGAYWFDDDTGNFMSSTYYFAALPAWVTKFNQEQSPARYFGKTWDRMLPAEAYNRSTADDMPYERKVASGATFPRTITGGETAPGKKFYTLFGATPFANDHLVAFAKAAIEGESLGADDITDLLSVSFSANDLLGHAFGPYSQEVQDISLRTDRVLADLFSYLDQRIGAGNYVVALTADHGVAPVPEQVMEFGYGGRLVAKDISGAATAALNAKYGEAAWVKAFASYNLYLDLALIAERKLNLAEVETVAAQAMAAMPGIHTAFTSTQLRHGDIPDTHVARLTTQGFYAPRNGNVIIVTQPFFMFGEGSNTTHGSPYSYDTHVPVLFYGAGIAPGIHHGASSPADIAPTLAALLQVQAPSNNIGRVLQEALKP
jgi:predicted AlkP superfamily pyrophosphatase or phosphodiesterase